MSIINNYLIKEIFKFFGIVLVMVVGIYVAVDFFEKIDNFMRVELPFSKAVEFFIFKIPFIITQITPVGILLSVLVVFGLMNKNNEIVALKSSGISIFYLFKPVLVLGIFFSIAVFILSEGIVPVTMSKANRIWLADVKKKTIVTTRKENIWIREKGLIAHINFYNQAEQTIVGVALNYFDNNFKVIKRVDARKGIFKQGKWVLHGVMEQTLEKKSGEYQVKLHDKIVAVFDFLPEDFQKVIKKTEEMNFNELYGFINKIETEGYDATPYRVDLWAKIAFPFACIIMCMVGTGIAVSVNSGKGGLTVGIALGIGAAFLYWIFYSFCLSLGYGEMLPPFFAAWIANLVFFCFGALMLMYAE